MTKYVYFLSRLYFPAPVTARAKKMNSNSKGWDAAAKVSPLARCEINAINMVNASTKAEGRMNNPIIIKSAPTHSAATAAKPQKEGARLYLFCTSLHRLSPNWMDPSLIWEYRERLTCSRR